ncbi:hypothetical protein [Ramlibacter sp.]|uniref:hypothetical protein n=1 Tax=Ramlibacter sp. TaxID=1917967 RepID=UPI003D11EAFC
MTKRPVIRRDEMLTAVLDLGGGPIDLADYATTGLVGVAVGPRGSGKTNAGLLIAEQLADQGWVSVLVDPELELESLYGEAMSSPGELQRCLRTRDRKILVVCAKDAEEFVPYGEAILEAADTHRQPIFCMIDEGQLFSAVKKRKGEIGRATDLINDFVGRGRKRALDLFMTALRYTGTVHREVFANKNLTLIGVQEDPTVWSSLAPQFRGSKISFSDVNSLSPGEFFCFSRQGVEKVKMPMAGALSKVARRARAPKRVLPANFSQWARAMSAIPLPRLQALSDDVVSLMGAVAGLTPQQMVDGANALQDELGLRT